MKFMGIVKNVEEPFVYGEMTFHSVIIHEPATLNNYKMGCSASDHAVLAKAEKKPIQGNWEQDAKFKCRIVDFQLAA